MAPDIMSGFEGGQKDGVEDAKDGRALEKEKKTTERENERKGSNGWS